MEAKAMPDMRWVDHPTTRSMWWEPYNRLNGHRYMVNEKRYSFVNSHWDGPTGWVVSQQDGTDWIAMRMTNGTFVKYPAGPSMEEAMAFVEISYQLEVANGIE